MQHEQRWLKGVPKSFLAGLLAVLLLVSGILAASDSLHYSLHHDRAADANACVICMLAHGHVDLPKAAPIFATAVFYSLCGLLTASAGLPLSFDSLLPPGRAPPPFFHNC